MQQDYDESEFPLAAIRLQRLHSSISRIEDELNLVLEKPEVAALLTPEHKNHLSNLVDFMQRYRSASVADRENILREYERYMARTLPTLPIIISDF